MAKNKLSPAEPQPRKKWRSQSRCGSHKLDRNVGLSGTTTLSVRVPSSVFSALKAFAAIRVMSTDEVCNKLISRVAQFTDVKTWAAPPSEFTHRNLNLNLEWKCLDKLDEISRFSRIGISSAFRRMLCAILITHTIDFIPCEHKTAICIEMRQNPAIFMIDFGTIETSCLLRRQHRGQHD
jgi:hypothetical protein